MNSQLSLLFFIIALLLICISCDTTEPPPGDKPTLALKLEDVSCTEAWIELTTANLSLPATITIKQNNPTGDTKSQILNLNTKDSLLYIDSLLPNKNYQYQVSSKEHQVTSNKLSVTTLDTTSQNFSFVVLEFGDGFSSSYFNDVWIFNENDIWVCGNVFTNDSTDGNLYQWNGS
nr:glucosyl transferase [Ignavibacteriaceae bacterium]